MTAPTLCEWPIVAPGEECGPLAPLDDAQRDRIERMATELLWNWTGRRYGLCEVSVRPCRAECAGRPSTFGIPAVAGGSPYWVPALIGGQWFNFSCGVCPGACTCRPDTLRSIQLPGPVHEITEVIVDGLILDPAAYSLRAGTLYRVDGGTWPMCNSDIGDPLDPDSGAWEITYQKGLEVPEGGQIAAGVFACELAKALTGDKTCALPQRVQSVTRQGVSVAILDDFADVQEGRTGIWSVDAWVASINAPRQSPPRVYSPDNAPGKQRGTMPGLGFGRNR